MSKLDQAKSFLKNDEKYQADTEADCPHCGAEGAKLFPYHFDNNDDRCPECGMNINESLGSKDRASLPQISDHEKFMQDLNTAGIAVDPVKIEKTKDVLPTQNSMDREKVLKIIASTDPMNPILVTHEGYILDGHHRWAAANETTKEVPVRRINLSHEDALNFLVDKDYAELSQVNEALNLMMNVLSIHPRFKQALKFYKGIRDKESNRNIAKHRAAKVAGVSPKLFSQYVAHTGIDNVQNEGLQQSAHLSFRVNSPGDNLAGATEAIEDAIHHRASAEREKRLGFTDEYHKHMSLHHGAMSAHHSYMASFNQSSGNKAAEQEHDARATHHDNLATDHLHARRRAMDNMEH